MYSLFNIPNKSTTNTIDDSLHSYLSKIELVLNNLDNEDDRVLSFIKDDANFVYFKLI